MAIKDCEFWRSFIDLYRELPEIWQTKSSEYKNRDKKKEAWETLLKKYKDFESQATIDVVKRKIMSLRSSYRRELAKIKKSERSGAGTDPQHIPTLWYFNELEFLKDQETQIGGTSTMDLSDQENEPHVISTQTKKRKTIPPHTKFLEQDVQHSDEANIRRERDEADIFSEGWAVVYRKLKSEQQIYAKQAIDEILFQGQLNALSLDFLYMIRNQTTISEPSYGNVNIPRIKEQINEEYEETQDVLEDKKHH